MHLKARINLGSIIAQNLSKQIEPPSTFTSPSTYKTNNNRFDTMPPRPALSG